MGSAIQNKSYRFAVRIVKLCRYLQAEHKEFVMSRQLMRSGTSIGANVSESQQAQSRADFVNKLNIALKESYETDYWLRLLRDTQYLTKEQFSSIFSDCCELERLLISIIKATKE